MSQTFQTWQTYSGQVQDKLGTTWTHFYSNIKKNPVQLLGEKSRWPSAHSWLQTVLERSFDYQPQKKWFCFQARPGDGKHFMQELNGVKQLVCAPGELQRLLFLPMAATFDSNCVFIVPFHRCWLWITPACFSHTSSSCAFSNVFVWVSTLPWSGNRVSVQAHRTILRIWAVTNVCFSHI